MPDKIVDHDSGNIAAELEISESVDGNVTRISYVNTEGVVTDTIDMGYATAQRTRNAEGRIIEEFYLDAEGNPVKRYGIDPVVVDPWASERDAMREYGVQLHSMEDAKEADCVIVAVAHKEFKALSMDDIKKLYKVSTDDEKVKGLYTLKALEESGMRYWRL